MYGLCEVSVHGDGNCQVSIVMRAILVQAQHFQHATLLGLLTTDHMFFCSSALCQISFIGHLMSMAIYVQQP